MSDSRRGSNLQYLTLATMIEAITTLYIFLADLSLSPFQYIWIYASVGVQWIAKVRIGALVTMLKVR